MLNVNPNVLFFLAGLIAVLGYQPVPPDLYGRAMQRLLG
jgi:hypothetical protein